MKQKMWLCTTQKGIANLNNHPDARVRDIIELTREEVLELFESGIVDSDVIFSTNDSVHIGIDHIIGDCILGDIVTLCELEMGITVDDSPFGVWR